MKTYVIGDIHGALTRLDVLLARCRDDAAGEACTFVFLGDTIDRGANSRGVVERLMALQRAPQQTTVCLKGNHEAMALAAYDDPAAEEHWLGNGGDTTLRDYSVSRASGLPPVHVAWMRSLPLFHDDGLRFCVHAGVRPGRALDAQQDDDLLWIREPFLSDPRAYGRLIVHGHTPIRSGTPDMRANRLNLDTGAAYGGPLTAAVFDEDGAAPLRFLQAKD